MKPMNDVVVLLPGILGSVLTKNGKDVWNVSGGAGLSAILSLGHSIEDLALTNDPPDVDDLGDGVRAPALLSDVHLIPGLWKIDGYTRIADSIRQEFAVIDNANFFEFPFDWRRDNRVAARQLKAKTTQWLADWRKQPGKENAQLVLLGHSMGGLVSRYFLEVLDGWKDTRALITFGTPYAGSLNALNVLANGLKLALGPVKLLDLTPLITSLTSVYQLLPTYPCFDAGAGLKRCSDPDAGIPNLDAKKAADASAFHREIREAVEKHLTDDEYKNNRYRVHPIVGTEQPTQQSARLSGSKVEMLQSLSNVDDGGDGTVPRGSATPREMLGQEIETYAPERHASLQNGDFAILNVKGWLSSVAMHQDQFRLAAAALGAARTISLSLFLEDAYPAGAPVAFDVEPSEDWVDLSATVSKDDGTIVAQKPAVTGGDGKRRVSVEGLAPGIYRVCVASPSAEVAPVTDVFAVLGG